MSITGTRILIPGVSARGERTTGRQAWRLLWTTDRPLSVLVIVWLVAGALLPGLVVTALGVVVGLLPDAIRDGLASTAGHRLALALVVAALIYALSLVIDPVGDALGTAASARITGDLQGRLLASVSQPVGVGHLEDAQVLDRLARAEGSLTGYVPGDAPVTWVGTLANRISGIIGCAVVAVYVWWLGLLLLVMWLAVRRYVLAAVIRQATELRGQTTVLRRAWYFIGVGSKARDAKEIRVFGLAGFVANRFRREYRDAMRTAAGGLRDLHRRAALCFVVVLAGYAVALGVIANDARTHAIGVAARTRGRTRRRPRGSGVTREPPPNRPAGRHLPAGRVPWAPAFMTLLTGMLVLGSVAMTCYPLGYRLLVDGALAGSAGDIVWGVVVVGGLMGIGWLLNAIAATDAMALSDRIALYRTAKLITLISGVSGMEHLEVSHRFSTVRMADLIIFIESGHAVEFGSHADMVAKGGRYAELFDLQAAGYG